MLGGFDRSVRGGDRTLATGQTSGDGALRRLFRAPRPMTPSPRTTQKHSLGISSISRSIAWSSRPLPDEWPRESSFSTSVAVPARLVSISPSSDSSCLAWTCRNGCSSWRADALATVALFVAICARFPYLSRSLSGVVAFYSVHNLPRRTLETALAEIHRVLKPSGAFVVATHLGEAEVYSNEFLGHDIATVGGTLYREGRTARRADIQSFVVETVQRRGPLPHEHNSERIYLSCRRAGT